jgi:hypothetical protein
VRGFEATVRTPTFGAVFFKQPLRRCAIGKAPLNVVVETRVFSRKREDLHESISKERQLLEQVVVEKSFEKLRKPAAGQDGSVIPP